MCGYVRVCVCASECVRKYVKVFARVYIVMCGCVCVWGILIKTIVCLRIQNTDQGKSSTAIYCFYGRWES